MAGVNTLTFTKDWKDPEDFPTHESDEEQVRADIQYLFDELRNFINQSLVAKLNGLGSEDVGVDDEGGTLDQRLASIAQDIASLRQEIIDVTLGQVPDKSINSNKLANYCITPEKVSDLEVYSHDDAAAADRKWAIFEYPEGYTPYTDSSNTHVFKRRIKGSSVSCFYLERYVRIPTTYDPNFYIDIDMDNAPFDDGAGYLHGVFPYAMSFYSHAEARPAPGRRYKVFRVTFPKELYDNDLLPAYGADLTVLNFSVLVLG